MYNARLYRKCHATLGTMLHYAEKMFTSLLYVDRLRYATTNVSVQTKSTQSDKCCSLTGRISKYTITLIITASGKSDLLVLLYVGLCEHTSQREVWSRIKYWKA